MGISRPKTGASRIKDRKAGKTFTTHRKGKKPGSIIKTSYFYPKAKKTASVPPPQPPSS